MKRFKIVSDDRIPFLRGVFEPYADVVYLPGKAISNDALRDADALLTRTRTRCDHALLAGTRVKIIATATIGFDHIDVPAMAELGVDWRNAPGCNSGSVAQYIGCALAVLYNGAPAGHTLGVVGVGNVGRKVAAVGRALGMNVLLNDPPREAAGETGFVDIGRIAAESDVVTCHVPMVKSGPWPTFHLADAQFFSAMKPGAFFINSSRGGVADNRAAAAALQSGKLGNAVFDVWENEPLIDRELLMLAGLSTPHIAGYSADGKANGTFMSVRAVADALGIDELREFTVEPPPPEVPELIDLDGLDDAAGLLHSVLHAYDIRRDSNTLKGDPDGFERQRGDYYLRREPVAFRVGGGSEKLRGELAGLGFKLV
ncbi:MAG: 4-phosphoerythronate dehydrogenase [Victivallaceae bacterium]|nr:4-phosphoerythronate dehydrogenase [Victivallaceae bacterium]